MKRKLVFIIDILILIIVTMLFIFFCEPDSINQSGDKLEVIATIFPNYDFVKQIGKDKVDVNLLLKSGVESHTYEQSHKDMVDIENSRVFIYTGNEFEPWAENILESINSEIKIVDTSKNVKLINKHKGEVLEIKASGGIKTYKQMNELINVNIKNENGKLLVSSRDIAKGLEKEHKDVLRKIRKVLDILDSDK